MDLIAGPEGKVNMVCDCQGGWEAMLWAALHPERVNTLIVAGAPIDTSAGDGPAKKLMPILIPRGNTAPHKAMVKAYGGIWPGINRVMGFIAMHPATHVAEHLKVRRHVHDREYLDHLSDFYEVWPVVGRLEGKEAVRDHFTAIFAAMPDYHTEMERMAADDETVFCSGT